MLMEILHEVISPSQTTMNTITVFWDVTPCGLPHLRWQQRTLLQTSNIIGSAAPSMRYERKRVVLYLNVFEGESSSESILFTDKNILRIPWRFVLNCAIHKRRVPGAPLNIQNYEYSSVKSPTNDATHPQWCFTQYFYWAYTMRPWQTTAETRIL
jgi:hypothetical protein